MTSGVFIVGGEGFVGSHIARACLAAGQHVTTFGPPMRVDLLPEAPDALRRVHGSAEELDAVRAALRASGARRVVWAAGFNAGDAGLMASGEKDLARAIAVNVGAWANVLRAAVDTGVDRVVACGSTVLYGAATDYAGAVDETDGQWPRTVYGLTKSQAESVAAYFARAHGLSVVTLRLPLVFGPGRWYGGAAAVLTRLLEAVAHAQPISLDAPAEPFDLIYVKDAARAVLQLLAAPHVAPVYNINGFTTSYAEIADTLRTIRPGSEIRVQPRPSAWSFPLMNASLLTREQHFQPDWALEPALRDYLSEF